MLLNVPAIRTGTGMDNRLPFFFAASGETEYVGKSGWELAIDKQNDIVIFDRYFLKSATDGSGGGGRKNDKTGCYWNHSVCRDIIRRSSAGVGRGGDCTGGCFHPGAVSDHAVRKQGLENREFFRPGGDHRIDDGQSAFSGESGQPDPHFVGLVGRTGLLSGSLPDETGKWPLDDWNHHFEQCPDRVDGEESAPGKISEGGDPNSEFHAQEIIGKRKADLPLSGVELQFPSPPGRRFQAPRKRGRMSICIFLPTCYCCYERRVKGMDRCLGNGG